METKFKDFKNLYEVRKTVRFELIPIHINHNKRTSFGNRKRDLEGIYKKLKNLVNLQEEFVNNLGEVFFIKEKYLSTEQIMKQPINSNINRGDALEKLSKREENATETKSFSEEPAKEENNVEIGDFSEYDPNFVIQFKYQGLEKVFRNEWIKNKKEIKYTIDKDGNEKKKNKNYITMRELGEKNFIKNFLEYFWNKNKEINNTLQKFLSGEHTLSRVSDISFEVQKLHSRDLLEKLYTLFEGEYITHKNDDNRIKNLGNKLQELKNSIQELLELTRPSQSFGIPIEHITLNYYTRNKTTKDYEDDIKKKREALENSYKGDLSKNLYGIDKNQSIKDLYKEMKLFKARQKSAFLQQLQNNVLFQDIEIPFDFIDFQGEKYKNFEQKLFAEIGPKKNYKTKKIEKTSEEVYNYLVSLTKDIEKEADKTKKKGLKEERGKYFQNHFKKYTNFCENYRKVAMEYGKKKAEVLSLEREKLLAERERGWGFITEKDGKYFLNTIPLQNVKGAFDKLKQGKIKDETGNISCYLFSSITLRALDKLCFKKDSTFMQTIKGKLDSKFIEEIKNEHGGSTRKRVKTKQQLKKENILIAFYNEVLKKQTTLKLLYQSSLLSIKALSEAKNEEDFEITLKQETYMLKEQFIIPEKLEAFLQEYEGNSYEITSWDLRKERNKPEDYTKYWIEFWEMNNVNNKYLTRINPEMMISFVEKDQNQKHENNRRKRDRYLLTSTFSFFTNKNYIDSAFIKEEERKENIKDFNKLYNKTYSHQYFYGLDRGTDELITLGIFKKGEEGNIKSVNLDKIEIYKITNERLLKTKTMKKKDISKLKPGESKDTTHILYKNPSMFLEYITDTTVFEKKNICSCLGSLNCAKLIDGKIIINGDISTYAKLCEINAKRLLYKAITEGACRSKEVGFNEKEQAFYYEFENRGKIQHKNIYFLNKFISPIILKADIEQMLNRYMKAVRNQTSEYIPIIQINNLRNAICANIVGIIMKLQEFYDGYIIWESLNIATNQDHLNQHNMDLGNKIIEKIYNKLQFSKQVPPVLKQFKHDIKDGLQHGKVIYVSEENTSSNCPVCLGKLGGHLTEFENKMKHFSDIEYDKIYNDKNFSKFRNVNSDDNGNKKGNKYQSGKLKDGIQDCDFYLKNPNYPELSFIKSGDDLATYNIAKKGKEYIEILKKDKNPEQDLE